MVSKICVRLAAQLAQTDGLDLFRWDGDHLRLSPGLLAPNFEDDQLESPVHVQNILKRQDQELCVFSQMVARSQTVERW